MEDAPPPLSRVTRDGPLPLTFLQEFHWLQHQLAPGRVSSNIPSALRLRGELDVAALERALAELVRRHEALRTTFPAPDGLPVQAVSQTAPVPLPRVDLAHLPFAPREREALRLTRDEAALPFDLERGPLMRARLLRLGAREWQLLATVHHIVCDGWSMDVLVRELGALYGAFSRGVAPSLPGPEAQFGDYAAWQRGWMRGAVLERHEAYWRSQLDSARPVDLAGEGPGEAHLSPRWVRTFTVPPETLDGLRRVGRQEGATLFMVLLAALKALVARYTGQEDLTVETQLAGRSHPELAEAVGFFAHMALLRTDLSGDPAFREAVRRVRDVTLGARDHQELPSLERVGAGLAQETARYQALRRLRFTFQQAGTETLSLGGLEIHAFDEEFSPAPARSEDMAFQDAGDHLRGAFIYRTERFPEAVVDQAIVDFLALMERVGANPALRISEVAQVSPAAGPAAVDPSFPTESLEEATLALAR
jgi:hypothetical protein